MAIDDNVIDGMLILHVTANKTGKLYYVRAKNHILTAEPYFATFYFDLNVLKQFFLFLQSCWVKMYLILIGMKKQNLLLWKNEEITGN